MLKHNQDLRSLLLLLLFIPEKSIVYCSTSGGESLLLAALSAAGHRAGRGGAEAEASKNNVQPAQVAQIHSHEDVV